MPEEAKAGRVDLRSLPLVTIDGEDARDFDDAVYCEKKRGGGWRLWVAIADVSYYVRPPTCWTRSAQPWHIRLLPIAGCSDATGSAV